MDHLKWTMLEKCNTPPTIAIEYVEIAKPKDKW